MRSLKILFGIIWPLTAGYIPKTILSHLVPVYWFLINLFAQYLQLLVYWCHIKMKIQQCLMVFVISRLIYPPNISLLSLFNIGVITNTHKGGDFLLPYTIPFCGDRFRYLLLFSRGTTHTSHIYICLNSHIYPNICIFILYVVVSCIRSS